MGGSRLLDRVRGAGAEPDDTVRQILDAAVATFQNLGIRRTTMDDIARAARLGRATVYRRFPQKGDLVRAALLHELRRFLAELDRAIAGAPTVRERLVEGFVAGVSGIREHPLLSRLLATEPNDVLPYLTVDGGPIVAAARAYLAEHIRDGIAAGEVTVADPDQTAEIMARIAHSMVLTPAGVLPVADDEPTRAMARTQIDALLHHNG
ncbi:MAG TPA: TetR/AcrR family transcriptional regulator [Actinophytocola sp.]|uniref:TetR/AcrR family transcriptional regulator n=1 Tax=Actinophytocola sp. TaxID=1872138 RepID=UPI002DDD81B4|nr:TetR/AcrR family transcriptional regulator [Actinophytocola sp.]HEV2779337.1 TetR/AcrR family transcriptional regulator [Actinophytocola sp.]